MDDLLFVSGLIRQNPLSPAGCACLTRRDERGSWHLEQADKSGRRTGCACRFIAHGNVLSAADSTKRADATGNFAAGRPIAKRIGEIQTAQGRD